MRTQVAVIVIFTLAIPAFEFIMTVPVKSPSVPLLFDAFTFTVCWSPLKFVGFIVIQSLSLIIVPLKVFELLFVIVKDKKAKIKIEGRHDPCIVPRAVPVVEAMVALVLADHGLRSGKIPRTLA